ncbi:efflux RND transporter permease subunit [Sulfurospirillum barnesii]|uniref:Cation/multidrug efflux pump n=1 Tax=Sulfurospirillum barnesii (strain ATCC 700032 / DSM 10660 / SES-3) TaxID=760154 RepID=I3XVK8_SULBS|nr:efflux RND transporter permease subunit [Sulfurospirillum barnesii]AFL67982.1 cation/multidrug efflux pump [Sulfurospirillum barnesii SES-3]
MMKRFEQFIHDILLDVRKKRLVLLLTVLAFSASLMMFPTHAVLAKMLPSKSTNTFSIYVDLPKGSSVFQTQQVNQCVVAFLQKEQEVQNIEVFNGMGSPLDYAGLVKGSGFKSGEHVSEIVVNLSDAHERDERSYAMVHRLRPIIQKSCEPLVEKTSIKMVEQPAGPPTQAALVIELYGEKSTSLTPLAEKIKEILSQHRDLADVDVLFDEIYPKLSLRIDHEKALRAGLSIEYIHKMLYLAFEGMEVSYKNSENSPSQIPIFVVLSENSKRLAQLSKEALYAKLTSFRLRNTQGMLVPLSEVVHIDEVFSTPTIMSKNLQTMVSIVAEADLVSQVYPLLDVRSTIKERLSEFYEIQNTHLFDLKLKDKRSGEVFELVFDGEMKVSMDTFRDLGGAFIAALVLIFLLMVVYYKSFAIAGIVLLGSFLSIIGVIFGHWLMDLFSKETFFLTATSLIGFIALMGISSRNSLLLIDFTEAMMKVGIEKKRAIALASATRSKPIFLTAAAIILASTLLATDPIFGGLGVALIFGTIAAVIVSLIVVPVLMDNTKAI